MVEDSPLDAELTLAQLTAAGIPHVVRRVDNRLDFIASLEDVCPELVLADYALPAFDGLSALSIAKRLCPDVPFIFVSGLMGEEVAIDSLQRGATDYVLKQRIARIGPAVRRALDEVRDRLNRRHAEEELARKAHELMVLNADLEQFAYAASHDLQEPLRTISVFSRLIIKKYRGVIDAEADEYLGYIESAAKHMSSLLENMLVYAKLPAHNRATESVDLNEVLNQTLFLFRIAISEAKASITSGELPQVPGNGAQLDLVFQNLIGNALKYRSEQPPRIHIDAQRNGKDWTISVSDNGIGFDPDYSEHIFGLFKRLDKGHSAGTGLGLAICRRVLDVHGGRIWAESAPNNGATFHFTIPAEPERSDSLLNDVRPTQANRNRR